MIIPSVIIPIVYTAMFERQCVCQPPSNDF